MTSTDRSHIGRQPPSAAKRWTVGGVALALLLALYSAARPVLNDRLGLNLPQLTPASYEEGEPATTTEKTRESAKSRSTKNQPSATQETSEPPPLAPPSSKVTAPKTVEPVPQKTSTGTKPKPTPLPANTKAPTTKAPSANTPTQAQTKSPKPESQASANDSELRYGILKALPRDEFISPAGLRYTRGSEEGHRLKHLERHTQDQPDRPGNHGVFAGGMEGMLKVLDEAYTKAKEGGKGVQKEEDRGRTIYIVDLRRRIGYIGGQEGNRRNKPHAYRVQLVLEGDRVITAYPR